MYDLIFILWDNYFVIDSGLTQSDCINWLYYFNLPHDQLICEGR